MQAVLYIIGYFAIGVLLATGFQYLTNPKFSDPAEALFSGVIVSFWPLFAFIMVCGAVIYLPGKFALSLARGLTHGR